MDDFLRVDDLGEIDFLQDQSSKQQPDAKPQLSIASHVAGNGI